MRRVVSVAFVVITVGLSAVLGAQNAVPLYRMPEAPIDARVADLDEDGVPEILAGLK